MRVGIVGAGLAGLTAAARLREAGLAPVVFEKSRGIGGRLATRRATTPDGRTLLVDHGAALLSPRPDEFGSFLRQAATDGDASEFGGGFIGAPRMSALPRRLAEGIDIRFRAEVAAATPDERGWRLDLGGGAVERVDAVILTAPAPQTARLAAAAPGLAAAAASAEMAPAWTLIAAWDDAPDAREVASLAPPLAALAVATGRPGRPERPFALAAHAREDWSAENLELEREEAAARLLPALAETLGLDPRTGVHGAAHRWRYARARRPVGRPCLAEAGLFAAGDWLLGPEAGDAWASGRAAAEAVLAAR